MNGTLEEKAARLRALHGEGSVLVLPNAWDAPSAAVIEEAGAAAIATSSAGVAWTLGYPDGERLSRAEMLAAVARIAVAVDVPVTADVEAGYGPTPADVAATVSGVIEAGAVGINLEDSAAPGALYSADDQAARIHEARNAAVAAGVPSLVVNARTDVYLREIGEPESRFGEVVERADSYAAGGADCLFVPGLLDLETLTALVTASPIPISVLARPGGPTIAELAATGARRISLGPAISEAIYGLARRAARELLEAGTYDALEDAVGFPELQALLSRRATPGGSASAAGA